MNNALAIILLLSVGSGATEGPVTRAAELKRAVGDLQKSPDDVALRKKIIALAAKAKPSIPEEARKHFVIATTLQKNAKSAEDYGQAVGEYRQALLLAPWWGDAYYNLSLVQESAELYDEAGASLELFLATKPKAADARRAQDRVYALEARKKLKASSGVAIVRAARERFVAKILGRWREDGGPANLEVTRDGGGIKVSATDRSGGGPYDGSAVELAPPSFGFTIELPGPGLDLRYRFTLEDDGRLAMSAESKAIGEPEFRLISTGGHYIR